MSALRIFLRKNWVARAAVTAIVLLTVSLEKSPAQEAASVRDLTGNWEGALGQGPVKLHIILTFEKQSDGTYKGLLNSVDQGAMLPMSDVALKNSAVHFELAAVGGTYDGTLSADGDEISGTWIQTGVPAQPLNFKRRAQEPASQGAASAAAVPTPKPFTLPLDIAVPTAPKAFKADGKWHLAYELHIANLGGADCTLVSIETVSGSSPEKAIGKISGVDLSLIVVHPGQKVADATKIAAGSFTVAYMWETVDSLADLPTTIRHKVTAKVGDYPEDVTAETSATAVGRTPAIVISPPLRGDDWLAANGPSNTSGHRRALVSIDGHAYIAQRFAIDWLELYPDGKSFQGDRSDNKNYRDYGAEIHSVASGTVTEVKDGIPQNSPGLTSRAVPITLETVGGNHVIVRIADGVYAGYMHMQPGSIRVKVGDKVTRGQVLGLLGNSGNSTEPHLHFQLCSESSTLACEGIPYAFSSFEVEGKGMGWKSSQPNQNPAKREMEIPLEGDVVRFPAAPQAH